jgi:hypothetical protein
VVTDDEASTYTYRRNENHFREHVRGGQAMVHKVPTA